MQNQIKSSLYSRYYAEPCNELRGPSPRLSTWATQLRRNVAAVANRWQHCADLTGLGIEPQTSRTDGVRLATELTNRSVQYGLIQPRPIRKCTDILIRINYQTVHFRPKFLLLFFFFAVIKISYNRSANI